MKAYGRWVLAPVLWPVFALGVVFWFPPVAAAQQPGRVWTLEPAGATADGRVRLSYGAPETDDTVVSFSCAPASGVVNVLILHTQQQMTRGARATARLSAGQSRWSIRGKILANDESLDESFAGSAASDPARFMKLAASEQLKLAVGRGPAQTVPLAGASDNFRRFSLLCAKP